MAHNGTKLRHVLRDDISEPGFFRRVHREYRELLASMLTEEQHAELQHMWVPQRLAVGLWWLVKGLCLKLSPTRRILVVVGVVLVLAKVTVDNASSNAPGLGLLLLLFVLTLELKDKLLAEYELADGRAVQKALMPPRSPDVDGWDIWLFMRSANDVGGDLVDFVRMDRDRVGIVLGDVAGKGLKAALLTAKLQATVRALSPECSSLAELASKVNNIFHRDSLPQMFASMVYAEIVPGSGSLRIINAGHLPPLLWKGGAEHRMEKGGAALGLMSGGAFTEQKIDLLPGDFLLIYSDGVTEARNETGEFYGDDHLRALVAENTRVSAEILGELIVSQVLKFQGNAPAHDDISLAIMKRIETAYS